MSKGWYVKVDTQVVFNVDTNIGVLASTEEKAGLEAQRLVSEWLDRDDFKAKLEEVLPWDLDMGGLNWNRGSQSADIDFDTMQAMSVTPDPDFDPDGPDPRDLMDAAMCLLEAFWELPDDDKRRSDFLPNHGIAVVRDHVATAANLCHQTWMWLHERDDYDECFDWDFCPLFLDRCMDDQLVLRSGNLCELLRMWKEAQ